MMHLNKQDLKLVFVVNIDWYFKLHWLDRAVFFKNTGFDIYVVTNFKCKKIKLELENLGFKCYYIDINRNGINIFKEINTLIKLKKILEKIKPNLIHAITVKPNIYVGILSKLFLHTPNVYSITGLGASFSSQRYKFRFTKFLITKIYRYISSPKSVFIFENSEDKNILTSLNIIKNNGIVIKGAGIDTNKFVCSPLPEKRRVLFAARLLKDKGLETLLEAKQILNDKHIQFNLLVAGIVDDDVSNAIPVSEILELERKGSIEWLGNVQDMHNLIKDIDIVCLPTEYGEGVPRILIEGASCARPLIASSVPGCLEIVEDKINGLIATTGSAISLSQCLELLLNNKQLQKEYGKRGRKKVKNEFAQEIVFKDIGKVYDYLMVSS